MAEGANGRNTIDERIDVLTMNVELLSHSVEDLRSVMRESFEQFAKAFAITKVLAGFSEQVTRELTPATPPAPTIRPFPIAPIRDRNES